MPTYLERYRQGDCESVWAEMLALGGQIREESVYADAQAVARETMARARANIELLVQRLNTMGYRFAYPDRVFVPADEEFRRLVGEVEGRAGPLPLSLRIWCEVVGEVNFMGSHPKLSCYVQTPGAAKIAQDFLSLFAKHGGSAEQTGDALRQGVETSQRLLSEVLHGIKTGRPRSSDLEAGLRASKEMLASLQSTSPSIGPDVDSDPLVVEPYFGEMEEGMEECNDMNAANEGMEGAGQFEAIIAPDAVHKTNHSGGSPYSMRFPDVAIDSHLDGDDDYGTFVEYLRTCFRWGGFPGLRASANPPREELAYLTQGLAPL